MNLIDLIFPKNCVECFAQGKYICDNCLKKVSKSGWYGKTYSVFRYEGVIRKAIIELKYKYSTVIANELSRCVTQNLKTLALESNNYCLVPIPLYWQRKNARGFNQSEEVGKLIAKEMGWEIEPNLLVKKTQSKPQVGLKGEERRKNLSQSFSMNPKHIADVKNNLIIFDDVMTTGTTLKEAAEVLKKAGFKNIWSLTIAR